MQTVWKKNILCLWNKCRCFCTWSVKINAIKCCIRFKHIELLLFTGGLRVRLSALAFWKTVPVGASGVWPIQRQWKSVWLSPALHRFPFVLIHLVRIHRSRVWSQQEPAVRGRREHAPISVKTSAPLLSQSREKKKSRQIDRTMDSSVYLLSIYACGCICFCRLKRTIKY